MNPKNPYVMALFTAIKNQELNPQERERRVAVSIETIVNIKPLHDKFKQSNVGNVDPSEEISLDLSDEYGSTPLTLASYAGDTESVRLLLEAKANPNKSNENTGSTPLILASHAGHTESVRLLLEAKADPNTPNASTGGTPLTYTLQARKTENVRLLLAAKANPNTANENTGCTPLIYAANAGSTENVRVLLEAKANLHSPNEKTGFTPLIYASHAGHAESVQLLLEMKVNPNTPNEKTGGTPLTYASRAGHRESVRLLLEAKVNPNTPNEKTGGTPLMHAAKAGHTESVRLLLAAKANPNTSKEKTGSTALSLALHAEHTENVRLLLAAKANPNTSDEQTGRTSLIFASLAGNREIVRLLLEAEDKVDADYLDHNGKTALDYAIEQNNLSMVLLLFRYSKANNLEKIHTFLSSQDQSDRRVTECLKIFSNNYKNIPTVDSARMMENEEIYLRKLITLQDSYELLFLYYIHEGSSVSFINGILLLMLDYDGRCFKPDSNVAPMSFFDAVTVNPHLEGLKKEIEKKSKTKPGFFSHTIQEINKAIALKKQETIGVASSDASASLNREQEVDRRGRCVVM